MQYTVYILISEVKRNWSYVGSTEDITRRFKQHTCGQVRSTKGFRPLKIIYVEHHNTRDDAYKRELFLKTGIGREEKQNLIKHSGIV